MFWHGLQIRASLESCRSVNKLIPVKYYNERVNS